ncbi:hypothetical protein DPMN_102019 [Dreissena polymorpha]|uniref:C2H2-type domain-containing protein n=1 Tax=Dreissena polymorpha TaxID=45954 RepID=A0A9D4LMC0_DREPO|nr:hypothetical protein DPMN_102019 [Dreissena polymorpha]
MQKYVEDELGYCATLGDTPTLGTISAVGKHSVRSVNDPKQHVKTHMLDKYHRCEECFKTYKRKTNLSRHVKTYIVRESKPYGGEGVEVGC